MKDQSGCYSEEYDCYYDCDTGEWLEEKCSDPACIYCVNRPDNALPDPPNSEE